MAEEGMRAATPPSGEKETKDKELQALKDAHAAIGKRLDALMGRGGGKHDARADDDDDRKDDDRSDDDDDRRRHDDDEDEDDKDEKKDAARSDDDDDRGRRDAGDLGLSMKDRKRKDRGRRDAGIENFGGKQAPPFKAKDKKHDDDDDDDTRRDAKRRDKDLEEWAEEEKTEPLHRENGDKPRPLAADRKDDDEGEDGGEGKQDRKDDDDDDDDRGRRHDDDDDDDRRRRDARHDSALRRRIEALERGASDEEIEQLAEEQQRWSEPALAHGERVSRPMHGESLLSYVRRNARHFQKYSDKWSGHDLRQLPASTLMKIAAPEIRKDAVAAAYRPDPNAEPVLREVVKTDRAGRRISEFVGPISAMLDPFRMPSHRVRKINTQPQLY